jgi:branched-subunit amino acid aminotransferase/4-amino-4-deoxychorismate lyase
MKIQAFEITPDINIPLDINPASLDGMTAQLPTGFYTTFCTLAHGTRVLGLRSHLRRLYGPAKEVGLHLGVDEKELQKRIAGLAKENLPHESRVRIILTKDEGRIFAGLELFRALPQSIYSNGVHVVTTDLARNNPQIKDTGFISSSADQRKQIGSHVFEVILTKNGKFLEGMTSNFYGIKRKSLVTAKYGVLPGVTRKAVLGLAKGEGMSIEYRGLRLSEKLDEAFLTSSSRGVVSIVSIDGHAVGQGRVGEWTKRLSKAYQAYVKERSESLV